MFTGCTKYKITEAAEYKKIFKLSQCALISRRRYAIVKILWQVSKFECDILWGIKSPLRIINNANPRAL